MQRSTEARVLDQLWAWLDKKHQTGLTVVISDVKFKIRQLEKEAVMAQVAAREKQLSLSMNQRMEAVSALVWEEIKTRVSANMSLAQENPADRVLFAQRCSQVAYHLAGRAGQLTVSAKEEQ